MVDEVSRDVEKKPIHVTNDPLRQAVIRKL